MERYVDILLERARMVKEWRKYVARISSAAKKVLPDAQIYVFGSVVRGEAVGGSDVDISSCPRTSLRAGSAGRS